MTDPICGLPYEVEEAAWRMVTRDVGRRIDPFGVIRSIPEHRSYIFWRGDDGRFLIGVGAAMRIRLRSSVSYASVHREILARVPAAFRRSDVGVRAFISIAFDPAVGIDREIWRGFAPVEICVPEVLIRLDEVRTQVTSFAQMSRFSEVEASAAAVLEARPGGAESKGSSFETDDRAYRRAVCRALKAIEAGAASKVVVARQGIARGKGGFDPAGVLESLATSFDSCFVFGMRPAALESCAPTFVGATPERLASVDAGTLETGALAGSAPRGVSNSMDEHHARALIGSDKERREHNFVAEMIAAAVGRLASGVERGKTRVERLANVQHLYTPIRAELDEGVGILDAVDALHPTPAVCGAPREAAREVIRRVEGFDRGLYSGAIGWIDLDSGAGDIAVAIRSALLDANLARLFAGAGIVAGSDPSREVDETRLKFDAVIGAL